MAQPVFTIGHSSRPLTEFLDLLKESSIDCVVDVRRLPGSRAFPQYDLDALQQSLAACGIDYWHPEALGGRRGGGKRFEDDRNALWQNASFRHYADYAGRAEFREALDALELRAQESRCALMCAEAVWWRCHRRIISDYLIADGFQVWHILGHEQVHAAELMEGAQVDGNEITYPASPDTSS